MVRCNLCSSCLKICLPLWPHWECVHIPLHGYCHVRHISLTWRHPYCKTFLPRLFTNVLKEAENITIATTHHTDTVQQLVLTRSDT